MEADVQMVDEGFDIVITGLSPVIATTAGIRGGHQVKPGDEMVEKVPWIKKFSGGPLS